jgi:hypothetical protein
VETATSSFGLDDANVKMEAAFSIETSVTTDHSPEEQYPNLIHMLWTATVSLHEIFV